MSADPQKVRAVFDCMMFLQGAARRESPAGMCLLLVELGAVELCISKDIVDEIRDVFTRPRIRQKFSSLTDQLVDRFLESLERDAVFVHDVPRIFEYGRDPKDEPYSFKEKSTDAISCTGVHRPHGLEIVRQTVNRAA